MSEQETADKAADQDERLSSALDRLSEKTRGPELKPDRQAVTSPMGLLAVFLSLVAIGIGSYAAFMFYNLDTSDSEDVVADRFTEMGQAIANNSDAIGNVSDQLKALQEKQSGSIGTLRSAFESRIAGLESASGTTSQDWVIAEVEYLLRMANQRTLMEQDPAGALALFGAADNILAEAEGLTAFPLREAMAADTARLEAVKILDKEGLYLRLSALVGQVSELRQRENLYSAPVYKDEPVSRQASTFVNRLFAFVAKAGSRIASLIDYRRNEVEITPILPPDEEYYLRQNLVLKLQMAQIALLERNGDIYSVSLEESVSWVDRYFDPSDAATTAMRVGLEELMAVDVQQDMPEITASLQAVRKLMSDFRQAEDRR
jgi:uroporphyrin-III C-methyltransferase